MVLNYAENRYSQLEQINKTTSKHSDSPGRWILVPNAVGEATPIVVDGIMYISGRLGRVYAIDVRKGSMIWQYDPQVPRKYGEKPVVM